MAIPERYSPRLLIHALALASGAVSLVYEVLWMRRFSAVFGAAAPAAAATLSAFFLGMAAGSALLGRLSPRWKRPVRVYALLETGAAAGAVLTELVLRAYDAHYPSLYAAASGSPELFTALKLALAAGCVFAPVFLMGGVLPLLAQALAADRGSLGLRAGVIYSLNTLGAALGAVAVPFVLLPQLGAGLSYLLAVASGPALGLAAWFADRGPAQPAAGHGTRRVARDAQPGPCTQSRFVLVSCFLSGALLLGLEVLWTRMFALVHENSVYSFAIVVAVFLAGLAGGAALAAEYLRRGLKAAPGLAAAWFGAGLTVLASPRLFYALTSGLEYSPGPGAFDLHSLWVPVAVMLPAALLAGTVLPFLMELAGGPGRQAGPALGRLLAANTVGAVVGPLAAGFVLVRIAGLWWSVAAAGITMLALGAWTLRVSAPAPRFRFAAVSAPVLVCALLIRPASLPRVRVNDKDGERILCLNEGSYGTVAVLEDGAHRWAVLNNHYVLGGTTSATEERRQAHLPLLLHPHPARVAFLGMGTGITAGAALLHEVRELVALELVPEVIHAARDHFAEANGKLASDPRVEILAEDARNFLKGSGRKFDVIIGDLVVPWRPGESGLFSLEHFRATREALLPGGIFCQWLPLFQLPEGGFRIAAATFLQVYPKATLWRGDFLASQPGVALVGQRDPGPLDVAAIDRRVWKLSRRIGNDDPYLAADAGLWLFLMGSLDASDPSYAGAKRHADSHPWLELLWRHGSDWPADGLVAAGRFEAQLFREVRDRPPGGTPLERLGPRHHIWRDTGAELWDASIMAAEGKEQEARAKAFACVARLPGPLQASLLAPR